MLWFFPFICKNSINPIYIFQYSSANRSAKESSKHSRYCMGTPKDYPRWLRPTFDLLLWCWSHVIVEEARRSTKMIKPGLLLWWWWSHVPFQVIVLQCMHILFCSCQKLFLLLQLVYWTVLHIFDFIFNFTQISFSLCFKVTKASGDPIQSKIDFWHILFLCLVWCIDSL